jgi:hypothetical protein
MRHLLTITTLLATLASPALAGGWIGGGGELVKDANNPWWIENTTSVTYCVLQDEVNFHLAKPTARRRVREAIDYWKAEFARGIPTMGTRVATQTFNEVSCAQSGVDLVFQLGTLYSEQIRQIENPTEFVSLAMRTDYDPVHMRGRGFIYVAPDSGPLRPNSDRLAERPWSLSDGGLLLQVLAHELGHVFGIQHSNDAPIATGSGLMAASFPEYVLDKAWAPNTAREALPPFFAYDGRKYSTEFCYGGPVPAQLQEFWGAGEAAECFGFDVEDGNLIVRAGPDSLLMRRIGAGRLGPSTQEELRHVVSVFLPKEQQVFPGHRPDDYFMFGPMVQILGADVVYHSDDGRIERQLHLVHPLNESSHPPMFGVLDGKAIRVD